MEWLKSQAINFKVTYSRTTTGSHPSLNQFDFSTKKRDQAEQNNFFQKKVLNGQFSFNQTSGIILVIGHQSDQIGLLLKSLKGTLSYKISPNFGQL